MTATPARPAESARRSGVSTEPLAATSPLLLEFVKQQILFLHPLLLPIWLTGLVSLLFGRLSRARLLGLTYLAAMTIFRPRPGEDPSLAWGAGIGIVGCILLGVTVGAITRLTSAAEAEVQSTPMLVVAVIGLFANAGALLLLRPAAGVVD